jgi:hypothetical protein
MIFQAKSRVESDTQEHKEHMKQHIHTKSNVMSKPILTIIRDSKMFKSVTGLLALSFLLNMLTPTASMALTGGPSQPEVNSFTPIGTSDMVDLFTGDFNYNIPLMDVGGYPLNLSYNDGITMDQEASWVGLGWNINPGVINRSMRSLPDDFDGDIVKREFNMKPQVTVGVGGSGQLKTEFFGKEIPLAATYSMGIHFDNYQGFGYSQSIGADYQLYNQASSGNTVGLGFSINKNEQGLSISPSLNLGTTMKRKSGKESDLSIGVGVSLDSRQGLSTLNIDYGIKKYEWVDEKGVQVRSRIKSMGAPEGGGAVSFVNNTYTPRLDLPRNTSSFNLSINPGIDLLGAHSAPIFFSGFTSIQRLTKKALLLPAYGYMNSHEGAKQGRAMLDFNREKDRSFSPSMPNLPVTNFTHDIYSINGQGVGGTFRPFRSDMGHVFDSYTSNGLKGSSVSYEVGAGLISQLGGTITVTAGTSTSGKWSTDNHAAADLRFKGREDVSTSNATYEPYYFKQLGELTVESDEQRFAQAGAFEAVQVHIQSAGGFESEALSQYHVNRNTSTYDPNTDEYNTGAGLALGGEITDDTRDARDRRNQNISILTKAQARIAGLNPYLSPEAHEHHTAEISVLRNDGARYVYGIAAYNTLKEDISFNASGRSVDCAARLVTYEDEDVTVDNSNGTDHFFDKTTLPAYAHSYLLTAVLSHDYEDNDAVRGPSDGDYGSYTKFNYGVKNSLYDPNNSEANPEYLPSIKDYKWRVPYKDHEANYSEGIKSDPNDDGGSIINGKKDIWYANSIETKTHIAIFHLSDREDGYEVAGEHGGMGARPMQKIDKIELYAKPDYQAAEADPSYTATPIKTVHFEYTYDLCKNLPNNADIGVDDKGSGKLTLDRVYFTYLDSNKGRLSDYEFTYADQNHDGSVISNPDYNLKAYNTWGGYKPSTLATCLAIDPNLSNNEFAFVGRNKAEEDIYAMSWCLSSIKLPSGGTLQMQYEADTYNLVQNKNAMQMLKIVGAGDGNSPDLGDLVNGDLHDLYNSTLLGVHTPNNYLYFELDPSITTTAEIEEHYLKELGGGNSRVYFRFLVDLTTSGTYDFVEGWATIDENHSVGTIGGGYGYLKVKDVVVSDNTNGNTNNSPIAKTAWHYARMHTPKLLYDFGIIDQDASPLDQLIALTSVQIIVAIVEVAAGPNRKLRGDGYGKAFIPNKSWIRLYEPTKKKLGGGSRVSQIKLLDNWEFMSNDQNALNVGSQYGQKYVYESAEKSYGVATYEPTGNKENPLVQPISFGEHRLLAPNDEHFLESPIGESFFPAPSIGYRQVEVVDLNNDQVTRHGTGKTIHSFFTCYDYPTRVEQTDLFPIAKKTSLAGRLLKLSVRDYMTVSQGYVVETNDMHGKPRSIRTYAEGQTDYISGMDYLYGTSFTSQELDADANDPNDPFNGVVVNEGNLDNRVTVINTDGSVEQKMVGVNFDIVNDFRESESVATTAGVEPNVNVFVLGVLFGVAPPIWPTFSQQKTRFRSAVTTKVVHRYGILREVVVHDKGASASTNNLAWDAETGEVLLTKTKNHFGDPIYSFNYPAHWTYDRMGQAYKNQSLTLPFNISSAGQIAGLSSYINLLVPGDEVIYAGGSVGKGWVIQDENSGNLYLVNKQGQAITLNEQGVFLTVTRSGRRNQQAMAAGSVASIFNPIDHDDDGIYNDLDFENGGIAGNSGILQAQAVEYSERWRTLAGISPECVVDAEQAGQFVDALNLTINTNTLVNSGTPSLLPALVENGNFQNLINVGEQNVCELPSKNCYPFANSQPGCHPLYSASVNSSLDPDALGFNSGYFYSHGTNNCFRNVRVTASPILCNSFWDPFYDRSEGDATGKMLMIDGAEHNQSQIGNSIWEQTQTGLVPGEQYEFAFYVKTVWVGQDFDLDGYGDVMPLIDFGIIDGGSFTTVLDAGGDTYYDGVLQIQNCFPIPRDIPAAIPGTSPVEYDCGPWHSVRGLLTAGPAQTSVTLAIVSKQFEDVIGNDFAIDDISFRRYCDPSGSLSGWWSSTVSQDGCTLTGTIGELDSEACPPCEITLSVLGCPAGFDFENIVSFNNIEVAQSGGNDDFIVNATDNEGKWLQLIGTSTCNTIVNCSPASCIAEECGIAPGDIVNPYVQAIRGHHNPVKTHFYQTDRVQDYSYTSSTNFDEKLNTRTEGPFIDFSTFWNLPTYTSGTFVKDETDWQSTVELTNVHPFGAAVETQDLLGRYAAEVLGFYNTLPVATGSNARYNQLAYDGFEDYDFYPDICELRHFGFEDFESSITEDEAHTGKRSLRIEKQSNVSNQRQLVDHVLTGGPDHAPYFLKEEDCIGTFGPETFYPEDRRYVLSFWRKLDNPNNAPLFDFPEIDVEVKICGTPLTLSNENISNIIEGWQQVECQFDIPSGAAGQIEVVFNNTSGVAAAFVDDIRIHPFNSTMTSYAYDPHTLWLRAQLDERNFATIYEYDEEGKLIRVKRETERGIVTVQESRSNVFKEDNE